MKPYNKSKRELQKGINLKNKQNSTYVWLFYNLMNQNHFPLTLFPLFLGDQVEEFELIHAMCVDTYLFSNA